jgi:hypothetical protein
LLLLALVLAANPAVAQHDHSHGMPAAAQEAFTATPAFAADGTLWLARGTADRVLVQRSADLGKTFSSPVSVTPAPLAVDWGPDSRPQIALTRSGEIVVSYAVFQDKRFNGRVFVTRSSDGGATFAAPTPITADTTSQRFQSIAVDQDGKVFAAWLDKRNVGPELKAGRKYDGAALAYAWSDGNAGFAGSQTGIAVDNTCECCRLGLAFAGAGRPAVLFRNIFPGSVRDHAVLTFDSPGTPGKLNRVSVDDWRIEACPHHGPSLAIAADGSYHAAWFTGGSVRQGLFYARADSAISAFAPPRALSSPDRQPSRPFVLAVRSAVHLVWKEFDGEKSIVRGQASGDGGRTWSATRIVAETRDASDHPLLVARGDRVFLSWLTKVEGYRLIALGDQS